MAGDLAGYAGMALEALLRAGARPGDRIGIRLGGEAYEGILIPRPGFGDPESIVVKLPNGYNIGIRAKPGIEVEVLERGERPGYRRAPLPPLGEGLPRIALIGTGGTIASRVDYRTGAVEPALSAEDLYAAVPELSDLARIEAEVLFSEFSENLEARHWREMAIGAARRLESGAEGVVIAHGTDTMGYSAAALSFALRGLPAPVILVGAQRSSDRPSSDAATNLLGAVMMASRGPFAEVAVAMHEGISDLSIVAHRGVRVRKCHTSRRDAFRSINSQPLARCDLRSKRIEMLTSDYRGRGDGALELRPDFDERALLLKYFPSMDPSIIDWAVDSGYRGLVIEGTGLGHVARRFNGAIRRAAEEGVVVCMASQCLWGRVNMNVYSTGRDLLAAGAIPLGDMLPETALVKLMWALGQTRDPGGGKAMMLSNLAGEISERSPYFG
ncbi:MAG: Glu-tRNA(Gln) amidotransferase subunit GatD [Candidatus Bathyarchaeia archaeon]